MKSGGLRFQRLAQVRNVFQGWAPEQPGIFPAELVGALIADTEGDRGCLALPCQQHRTGMKQPHPLLVLVGLSAVTALK